MGVRGRGVRQIQCTEQGLFQWSVIWSFLCGATVAWEPEEMGWSLSVGSPVGKESAGGPQPALPFFSHFPVCRLLVLVSPLLPPEEAELGGRAVTYNKELDKKPNNITFVHGSPFWDEYV